MTTSIIFSSQNIDYSGYDPIPSQVSISDTRLIEIFFRRINMRQREFNPMAQSTRPEFFSDSSSDEIGRIDSLETSDLEDQ